MSQQPVSKYPIRFKVGDADFIPGKSPFAVSWVNAADYTAAKQASQPPAWRPIVGEEVTLNFGDYYFRVDRHGGGSVETQGMVRVDDDLKGLVSLPAP